MTMAPCAMVRFGNQAILAFTDTLAQPRQGHFAFLVNPAEFERIRRRLADEGITTHADPGTWNTASTTRRLRAAGESTVMTRTATHRESSSDRWRLNHGHLRRAR